MDSEIETLMGELQVWNFIYRCIYVSKKKWIFDVTWLFKRKGYLDGTIKKLKARICFCGDQQVEGIDFDDVFSPVVSWACVRLLLILLIIHQWKTVQVDYTLAFIQATIEPGKLYCEIMNKKGRFAN